MTTKTPPEGDAPSGDVPRVTVLQRRLEDGYRRIEEARLAGQDIRKWEAFWLGLLAEYEAVCDALGGKDRTR